MTNDEECGARWFLTKKLFADRLNLRWRTWRTGATVDVQALDGIEEHKVGAGLAHRLKDASDVCLAAHVEVIVEDTESFAAVSCLFGALFSRNIEHTIVLEEKAAGDLH